MAIPKHPSRRAFLGGIAAVSALWSPLHAGSRESLDHSLEYVALPDFIDVFRTDDGGRRKTQSVASRRPSFLALDQSQTLLFAVNEIDEFEGLPTGSVESYEVEPGTGYLTLISRRPLSLSATMPRHLAIAPDRQYLVVAAYGGGAYNVLPIHRNGELGLVTQIVKEIGCGPHPEKQAAAHPHSVRFHPTGKFLLGTDLGSDRINVFSFEDGHMSRVHGIPVPAGSGPAQITMNPIGSLVFVLHELSPLLSCYQFDAQTGSISYLTSRNVPGGALSNY